MYEISDENKKTLFANGTFFDYEFYFPEIDYTITNETLHQESVTISQSICENDEFTLGGCIASQITFEVSEILDTDITGLEFIATLIPSAGDFRIPMGVYRVASAKEEDEKDYKNVVAYDKLYDMSIDVSEWYNSFFENLEEETSTLKEFRESLLEYLGVSYKIQNLVNDDMPVWKTIEPQTGTMTGQSVLINICTINGGFGIINREGLFEIIYASNVGYGLYPEEDLYPEENLYPQSYAEVMYQSESPYYKTVAPEEYITMPISCLVISSSAETIGVTIGDDLSNPYAIYGNYLLYNKDKSDLMSIGQNILDKIIGLQYNPMELECEGMPYMDCGDCIGIERNSGNLETIILSREFSGIQSQTDKIEAKGTELRENSVEQSQEIITLNNKTYALEKSVDGLKSVATSIQSKWDISVIENGNEIIYGTSKDPNHWIDFVHNRKNYYLKNYVNTNTGQWWICKKTTLGDYRWQEQIKLKTYVETLETSIEQNADEIALEAKRAKGAENELVSRIAISEGELVLKVDSNGNLALVELSIDPDDDTATQIQIQAKNINITAEELLEFMSNGTINLTSKNINIQSDNFNVGEDGTVSAKSIDISGGSINLVTDDYGDNLICLRNVSYDTGEYSVSLYGNGDPYDIADIETGECYLDLDTGAVWEYRTDQSGVFKRWMHVYTCEDYRTARYEECTLNTSDGVSASTYQLKVLTVDDGYGGIKEVTVKDGTSASIDGYGLHLHKDIYSAPTGNLKEEEIDAHISMSEYYDESNNAQPEIITDAPVSVPKITAGNMASGSVVKYLTKDIRYYVSVSLDMESAPYVIVTPETTNPSAVSVSVANVSNTGFDIYMHRTDTDGNLRVYWTAMC